jgi:serine/threonine-protein kinase HipA
MGPKRLGVLEMGTHGRLRLDYDDEYLDDPSATPLSTSMPLSGRSYVGKVVVAFLQGLLPDDDDVLRRWAARFHVPPGNLFGLLSHVGEDCAGGAQFVRPERLGELRPGGVRWLADEVLRERVELLRTDPTSWLDETSEGRFSLAGAQAKFALLHDEGRWGEPYGAVPTTHIIKPPSGRFADLDLNEHLCLSAARLAGLPAARSALVDFAGERAVAVERYDRLRGADGWLRVHQEDLCQAFGLMPDRKYESEGGPGAADICRLLRRLLPGADGDGAVADFLRAVAFNWLIGGTDAHAKNYSLLLAGPQVRLAPLYDLVSGFPYLAGPRGPRRSGQIRGNLKLAMKVGANRELGLVRKEDWEELAAAAGTPKQSLLAELERLVGVVPPAFAAAASADDVVAAHSKLPQCLVQRVEANVMLCKNALAGRPGRQRPGASIGHR